MVPCERCRKKKVDCIPQSYNTRDVSNAADPETQESHPEVVSSSITQMSGVDDTVETVADGSTNQTSGVFDVGASGVSVDQTVTSSHFAMTTGLDDIFYDALLRDANFPFLWNGLFTSDEFVNQSTLGSALAGEAHPDHNSNLSLHSMSPARLDTCGPNGVQHPLRAQVRTPASPLATTLPFQQSNAHTDAPTLNFSGVHPAPNGPTSQAYINDDKDVLLAEHFCHVPAVSPTTHAKIQQFHHRYVVTAAGHPSVEPCPPLEYLEVYVQLYFEHCHEQVPFLHVASMSTSEENWSLVMALAAVGVHYSEASLSTKHSACLESLARHFLVTDVSFHD